MLIREMILSEFEPEMAQTRKLLEMVPEGDPDFKPHAKSMPLMRLASHVAEMPRWAETTMNTEVLTMTPGEKPFLAQSTRELLEQFDKYVNEARTAISKASDADLNVNWKFVYAGKTFIDMPRYQVLSSVVLNHLVHHRAQLQVYLRMKDIAVPGMYGPSADEMNMFSSAGA